MLLVNVWICLMKVSTVANKVMEKRQRGTKFQNQKLKGKESCENEHREPANFIYNVVQKTTENNRRGPAFGQFCVSSKAVGVGRTWAGAGRARKRN